MGQAVMEKPFEGAKIAWLLPRIEPGSGGQQTVFRHVTHLQALGAECHVLTCQFGIADNVKAMAHILENSYQCRPDKLFDVANSGESYDLAIATMNTTVPYLFDINARKSAYFVQDYEPYFYAVGDAYEKALDTYRDDLHVITIGNWLVHKLGQEHGLKARHTDFTADEQLYRPLGLDRKRAVCAIFQPEKPRRCHELVIETLQVVNAIAPDVSIILYGSDARYPFTFPVENRGLISKEECNRLYNECMAGLCISSTNPSRVPFEMMAAGLPVVDLYQDNMLWDFASGSAVLAEPNCAALATAILSLIEDPKQFAAASQAGLSFMSSRVSGGELRDFAQAVQAIMDDVYEGDVPSLMYTDSAVKAPEEVRDVARAVGLERRMGAVTPPAIDCSARYIRVGLSGLPECANATDVYFNVWRDDRKSPAFIRYNARGCEAEEFWAQIDVSDFGSIAGLYHCQAWCRLPDVGIDYCCVERSLRIDVSASTGFPRDEASRLYSHRESYDLSFEFSSKPYAFSAKSVVKRMLPERGVRFLRSIVSKIR